MFKACLTQNTRLIRLAIRVNRTKCTYKRTNRGLIRVSVYPWKPCMIFKTFKKTDTGAMSMYNRISDRTRPWETVWDRTRPYIQPHMKSTQWVSSTGFIRSPYDQYGFIRSPYKYELYMVICHFYAFSVESSKICEAKPSKRVNFISKHTLMCDNTSITRTKVGGTVCKPCKCPVNRVKVVFNLLGRNRPY